MDYITINIRVHDDNGSYVVTANSPRSRKSASCVFHMPSERWQDLEPSLRVLKARSGELSLRDHIQEIQDFGQLLFNGLIHNEVRALYDEKKRDAFQNSKILRLRLNLLPLDLAMLPWELLYDDRVSGYLCLEQKPKITIIRSTDHTVSLKNSVSKYPPLLHILGITATPATLDFLDTEKEQHIIKDALKSLIEQEQVHLVWKPGKYAELSEIRLGTARYDIFHFTGHGRLDEQSQQGQLAFEGERRLPRYVPAEHLRMFLHPTTKLVVLNACETAAGNRFNHLSNIAYSLIKAGFPAVIAMQFKITDTAALKFSKTFYTLLARGIAVDEAVMEARQAIYLSSEETNPLDWAAPIFSSSSLIPIYMLQADPLQPNKHDKSKDRPEHPIIDEDKVVVSIQTNKYDKSKDSSEHPIINDEDNVLVSIQTNKNDENKDGSEHPIIVDKNNVLISISNNPSRSQHSTFTKRIQSLPLWQRFGLIMLLLLIIGGGSLAGYTVLHAPGVITLGSFGPCNNPNDGSIPLFIGTEFPTSEPDASAAKLGADLAIKENHTLIPGYTLNACDQNDAVGNPPVHSPEQGAQNMQLFANDPSLLGVVGPENSNVAFSQIPIAANAGLAMISPSVTNPCVTILAVCTPEDPPPNQVHPAGKANTFFRLPGNDLLQGAADAKLAKSLGIQKVCVVDDGEVYGQALVKSFSTDFGSVIEGCSFQISSTSSLTQLNKIAGQIADSPTQAVFYGGSAANQPGELKQQLSSQGFKGYFLGGDGIGSNNAFLSDAGPDATNSYATSLGPDPMNLPHPGPFVKDYTAAYDSLPSSRSALGYDAAMILIKAIQSAVMAHAPNLRSAVRDNVQNIQYQGLTGEITFDSNGDNSAPKIFSVYKANQGTWVYQRDIQET